MSMAPMLSRRREHAMVNVNEDIYVFGGRDYNDYLNTAETFNGWNENWRWISNMPTPMNHHCVVTLDSNTILAIGGYDGSRVR